MNTTNMKISPRIAFFVSAQLLDKLTIYRNLPTCESEVKVHNDYKHWCTQPYKSGPIFSQMRNGNLNKK